MQGKWLEGRHALITGGGTGIGAAAAAHLHAAGAKISLLGRRLEPLQQAAGRLGVDPANCVVFEDSPGGMQAARSAGAHLVGLLTTLTEAPSADLAIPDFLDERLLPWISALEPR